MLRKGVVVGVGVAVGIPVGVGEAEGGEGGLENSPKKDVVMMIAATQTIATTIYKYLLGSITEAALRKVI
ncbi:MAG: hypothetical protein QXP12_06550 [Ignisphaera sp.]